MPDRVDAVNERIAKRLGDVEQFMRKMQRYVVTEEWDLARGLCHVGAAVFEGLRDDTNLLADLEGEDVECPSVSGQSECPAEIVDPLRIDRH